MVRRVGCNSRNVVVGNNMVFDNCGSSSLIIFVKTIITEIRQIDFNQKPLYKGEKMAIQ
jgi:hypothetical protein